jgi:hypothetical protein
MLMPIGFHAIKMTQWHNQAYIEPGDRNFWLDFPRANSAYLLPIVYSEATILRSKIRFMKKVFLFLFVAVAVTLSSCAVHVSDSKVPPGQAKKSSAPGQVKKQTGSQSAKPYAPGQKKKS